MENVIQIKRSADTYLKVGQKKRQEGKPIEAVYYFYLAYKNSKGTAYVDALVELGDTYCEMDRYQEAIEYYFLALDKSPLSMEINSRLSKAYTSLGEDDISFFYLAPGMSLDRYRYILRETEIYERQERGPSVRVVEKSDEATLNIAVKLFESGDSKYAAQLLEAVKPESNQFVTASNMLALYEIEQGSLVKAAKHLERAVAKKDNVLARCSQLLLLSKATEANLKDSCFDALRQLTTEGIIAKIESFNLTETEQKSVALSFIRSNQPHYAIKHLAEILKTGINDRELMICYALCLYACNHTDIARKAIFNAHYAYPEDATINYFLKKIISGQKNLGLGPRIPIQEERAFLVQIDKNLDIIYKGDKTFYYNSDFKEKLVWLYQSGYSSLSSKASLVLGQVKSYGAFLRSLLLRDIDTQSKKVILFALLLSAPEATFVQKIISYERKRAIDLSFLDDMDDDEDDDDFYDDEDYDESIDAEIEQEVAKSKVVRGIRFAKNPKMVKKPRRIIKRRKLKQEVEPEQDFGAYVFKGRLGIVLDDFYIRIKMVFPKGMDSLFHTSYCAAFSSFVFCDSCFEDRLLATALRALKKYNAPDFDREKIKSEEALGAALFFATHHAEISTVRQCSQLFGCTQQQITDYLRLLSLRKTRIKTNKEAK